ncbi:MAG: prepilin peptidase [Planctomycetota bacterium]
MPDWFFGLFERFEAAPRWLGSGPWIAVAFWFAAVGGCVGSFLNVVALRAPRGDDVVFQPSACPVCGQPIRWRHNLPVIGWLVLRGRCYDCHTPIPARYWLWEVAFAAAFCVGGMLLVGQWVR